MNFGWFTIIFTFLLACFNKVWEPVAAHIGYPINLDDRVQDLLDADKRLDELRADLIILDPYPFTERCKGWCGRVHVLHNNAKSLKTRKDLCGWLSYFGKCKIGKQADRELNKAFQLLIDGKDLLLEAQARPRPGCIVLRQHPLRHQLYEMDSHKKKIMKFLSCMVTQSALGIWGMGGVGKTALIELVRDSRAEYSIFDYVIFVQAGRDCTADKLMKDIGISMGLPLGRCLKYLIANNLKDKHFLLLVDDLWDPILLEAAGIPMPLGSVNISSADRSTRQCLRKVVFTTRILDVCGKMECSNNTIHLGCLSAGSSWKLFTRSVQREIANDSPVHHFAKKIVDECDGLPMALRVIGEAMSTRRDLNEWECVVDFLKESKLTDIDDTLFPCLKVSYDSLPDVEKSCFLVCSLWPENENIPIDKLLEWWMGLGLLDVHNPVVRGISIIKGLVSKSLLLKGDDGLFTSQSSHVKIQKMMRKMALREVNDCGDSNRWLPHSVCRPAMPAERWKVVQKAWVSSVDSQRWPGFGCFPMLSMFVTRDSFPLEAIHPFNGITFLDLMGTRRDIFPMEICTLNKLQYLNLSATTIRELPQELKKLSNLKYLYMRDNSALQVIPKQLISKLTKLLVLDLYCSSGTSHRIQYFASLMKDLTCEYMGMIRLGINVHSKSDVTTLGQLNRSSIFALCLNHFQGKMHPEKIDLQLLSKLNDLRELAIVKCPLFKELVAESNPRQDEYGLLPRVEFLQLSCLENLQKVTWSNAGRRIRFLGIYNCRKMKHMTWVQNLPDLEELSVSYCPEMEQIIDDSEIVANQTTKIFRSLKRLYLEELPNLSNISNQTFSFNELTYVRVSNCHKLKGIRIAERVSSAMIKIDCSESWWRGLGFDRAMMNYHFVWNFCF